MKVTDKYFKAFNPDDVSALEKAIRFGPLSGKSNTVDTFENKIQDLFRSEYCVAQSSGTASIHASLAAAGIGQGDEVLAPAYSTVPTLLPILALGATIVFYDCENNSSLQPDFHDIKLKTSSKTKAIIGLPLWGYPVDYRELANSCIERDIFFLEDTCQAHFSSLDSVFMGNFGDVGCFSMHDKKILSTGEGGFTITSCELTQRKIRKFTMLGGMDGSTFGLNYKLGSLQAALGNSRIDRIDEELKIRACNADSYRNKLGEKDIFELDIPRGGSPNYYNFVVHLGKAFRDNTLEGIHSELSRNGFKTDYSRYGGVTYNSPTFSPYRTVCKNAEQMLLRKIPLPTHPDMSEDKVQTLVDLMVSVVEPFRG